MADKEIWRRKMAVMGKSIRTGLKLAASAFLMIFVLRAFFLDGINPYYTVKEYLYQNDFIAGQAVTVSGTAVSQHFVARGNIISNISLYLNNTESGAVDISLSDTDGRKLKSISVDFGSYTARAWNSIAFECNMKRGSEYILHVQSEKGLRSLLLDTGERPETYLECETSQGVINGSLVAGIQQTYCYMTWASALELAFGLLVLILLSLALCYAIFHIEELLSAFTVSEKGLLHAVYFAATLVFVFNPMDGARTEAGSFDRIIGEGFTANVDVSKRISSFNHWFIFWGVAVMLFYLLISYFRQKDCGGEKKKVLDFLDQLMILADVNLMLRCITYFADQTDMRTVFHYSAAVIQLAMIVAAAYFILGLEEKILAESYLKLQITAFCTAYPAAVIVQKEWQSGKLLFGIQAVIMLGIVPVAYYLADFIKTEMCQVVIHAAAVCAAGIPFVTSFYIELINILNQHGIFVTHLRRYYAAGMLAGLAITLLLAVYIWKKGAGSTEWKKWSYSWLVFGITCLSVQIPLKGTYHADIFEAANSSILISDFLNYGDIPIVQHYGGHMMSGVWEGLIYAVMNNDCAGAVFSPYSGYHTAVLAVLFFALARKVWNEEAALFATLFFPFLEAWNYYGLGMLVCLAVWAYIKKNTYPGAALIWMAFIWCAVYRLDLGFSVGLACILAVLVYAVSDRNWKAVKQLSITLAAWGVLGGALWFVLCLRKEIDPVNRLLEFLLISLSNQGWAFASIGDTGKTLFSWCYLLIPFVMAVCLTGTIFSKGIRKKAGDEKWMLLLIFGFSYFTNFSRGLVRHSLVETALTVILWDAYLYIAVFLSVYKQKKEWFLPVFAMLAMCNTLFTTTANYNATAIGDQAVSRTGDFTETWTLDRFAYEDLEKDENGNKEIPQTYWEKIQKERKRAVRTEWDETLECTAGPYALVLDALLEENETFVDFMNKTFLYSAINRRNPVYVSQSPLQLSGEYTQEMFVEQIKGIPAVLMPLNNDRAAACLDGIANAYRYYKVSEYIYQNYVPFCRYGTSFAVWCLPERYEEFHEKAELLAGRTDCTEAFQASGQLGFENCKRQVDETLGDTVIVSDGTKSAVTGLQSFMDLKPYEGKNVCIMIEYDTDTDGQMQIFYTAAEGENDTGEKSVTASISGRGAAEFIVPVTECTGLKLGIPEGSAVRIKSLKVGHPVFYIDHGYDGPDESVDENGNTEYSYSNGLHTYSVAYLPNIWAEYDDAVNNTKCCSLTGKNGIYVFDRAQITSDANGNYLHITADYAGTDTGVYYQEDDEAADAVVKIGIYKDGRFIEKYQYSFVVKEGRNAYLIRISSDYNWYLGEVNAAAVFSEGVLRDINMNILEGD